MSKKKAIGGFLTVVGLFGILWILLWYEWKYIQILLI